MAYEQLILLAPCHGLEDFPLYHTGDDAGCLLAGWTSLWHPEFIRSAKSLPRVERCDYPPEDLENALLLLPEPCEGELDPDLPDRAAAQNAKLIHVGTARGPAIREALKALAERAENGEVASKFDPEIVRDFLAFGFAFFQVEVLTQQMRYASSIDSGRIQRELKAAADAVLAGDISLSREKLTTCHDALTDERNHFYPVEVYLLDLTLLADSAPTLGASLSKQLELPVAQNLLASGQVIEQLAVQNADALQTIRSRLIDNTIGIAGGEYEETSLNLLSPDAAAEQLERGHAAYMEHLGEPAHSFARRKHGMYPSLASVIRHAGLKSALHMKYDEGKMPESHQGKTKWQLGNADLLDCYARAPLDASQHETFLNLPTLLSDTMDTDHVAVRMFVHWPGHATPWYGDLLRCARYGTALGRFVTVKEFFEEAADFSEHNSFSADDYVYSTLKQAAAGEDPNSVSRWPEYWRDYVSGSMEQGLEVMQKCHSFELFKPNDSSDLAHASRVAVLNPTSFPRRILLRTKHGKPASGSAVYASDTQSDNATATLVDVPAMGFANVSFSGGESVAGPDLAGELTLQNEFFQAAIDRETGGLRSLRDYKSRTTRLSQQVAFRITLPKTGQHWVDRQAPVAYSVMAADSVEITQNGKVFAEITATGRMLALNGELVGTFTQRYQITRGSRVLVVETDVTTDQELLLDDPWDSYYAFRFAFGDESAILRAGTRLQSHDVSRGRFEAPLFVDIDCANSTTTILSGGLAFSSSSTNIAT